MHTEFLIIGAGPTGLGAAIRLDELGRDFLVLDANSGPGGMAASYRDRQGFTWDMGGHVLHSHFPAFDELLAGVEMSTVTRNGWNLLDGQLVPTPIQHQLTEVPPDVDPDADSANLAEYYRHQFGAELAQRFFIPLQEKMWATDCTRMGHEWTSLRSGSGAANVPRLTLGAPPKRVEQFPYPRGGNGTIWERVHDRVSSRVQLDTRVTAISPEWHIANTEAGDRITYEYLISTMPLPTLATMAGLSFDVSGLRANGVHCIGFGFEGEPPAALADKTWLYCPDRDVPWYRATMLSNYDQANAGPGRWNILFEVGTSPDFRPIDRGEAEDGCLRSLQALGMTDEQVNTSLVALWSTHVPTGYPVPTLGRDELIHQLDDVLIAYGIRSRGRFGGWRYESCNQDTSYQQGREAVDAFLDGSAEDALWHPEKFS